MHAMKTRLWPSICSMLSIWMLCLREWHSNWNNEIERNRNGRYHTCRNCANYNSNTRTHGLKEWKTSEKLPNKT